MDVEKRGGLFVVSAPSGAGKHTILEQVLAQDDGIEYSVSATTRQPRPDERDGIDYHFLSREEFLRKVEAGEFVEWAEVHGNLYGTPRAQLEQKRASGKDVVIQVDVQGMRNLRRSGMAMTSVFVAPPSIEELERRLRERGADEPEAIAVRLRNAQDELAAQNEYDHVVVNDRIGQAVADFCAIIRAERRRQGRQE
jgi:guanylate kinase